MKITQVSQFQMQWLENYEKFLGEKGHKVITKQTPDEDDSDVLIFHWCDADAVNYVNGSVKGAINHVKRNKRNRKYIVFVRRYEIYSDFIEHMDWERVDAVVMVNDYLAKNFEERTKIKPHVIYNGVDPAKWTYKEREPGKKIAWVGYINQKKNLPLAIQILLALPRDYTLHIAGEVQDPCTMDYLFHMKEQFPDRIFWNGEQKDMDKWLDDKSYILSTAISEGCPNHVIEAMAKGIKPVVHNWPGAKDQFGAFVFNSIEDAKWMILSEEKPVWYNGDTYRKGVIEKFSINTYEQFYKVMMGLFPKTGANPSKYEPDFEKQVAV